MMEYTKQPYLLLEALTALLELQKRLFLEDGQ